MPRLLADGDFAAADIDVGVAERGDQLRNGDVVGFELLRIGVDIELLGGAAPAIDLDHAGNGEQAAGDDVILQGAEIGQAEMRWPLDLVAVDLADQARLLDGRHQVARQGDVLLQADRGLGQREIVVDAVSEGDANKRQSVERGRADIDDARRRIEPDFHRNGIVFLHLLGGEAGGLCRDLENDRSGIGIGLDIEPGEREDARRAEYRDAQHDDRTARQCKLEN
jgi:hypothetical protein